MTIPDISIIGIGAVGRTMALALNACNFPLKSLYNRHPAKAENLASRLGVSTVGPFPKNKSELGEMLFLGVPDTEIRDTADRLAGIDDDFESTIAVHFSGTGSSQWLDPLRQKGASAAAFHPLQTFNAESDPVIIRGIHFSVEGDDRAVAVLQEIAAKMEAHALVIDRESKPYLHAAAVIASNYLLSLMEAAGRTAAAGGMDERQAREALMPLVRQTLVNATATDLSAVLSGPIARGDAVTVQKHLQLLEHNAGLSSLYKSMGLYTVKLAESNGKLNRSQVEKLKRILNT